MYETGAPPAPPPLPADATLVVDPLRVQPPGSSPVLQYDSPTTVLPGGPPPGTVTYRLRGTETARTG